MDDIVEQLAAIEHARWAGWEKYREVCVTQVRRAGDAETHEDRWRRLRETPYDRLTEKEKESDRVEARKSLAVMDAEIARLKAEAERHLRCASSYPEKQAACARKDDEIARLKAEVSEARRHAVGVMAAGFNRALDDAGAPAAESPGLRIYAMRDEIERLKAERNDAQVDAIARGALLRDTEAEGAIVKATIERQARALAAGSAALRAMGWVFLAEHVEDAQEAALKGGG